MKEEREKRAHETAIEYIMDDERLSDKGKQNMLAPIEDPKKAEDYVEKRHEHSNERGWRHDGIARELYAHFECSMEMVDKCFAESLHKDEIRKAQRMPFVTMRRRRRRGLKIISELWSARDGGMKGRRRREGRRRRRSKV